MNWKAFFVCLALTNLRIGELLALQWMNVDWINRKLTVCKSVWRGKLMSSTKRMLNSSSIWPEPLFRVLQWHRQVSKHTSQIQLGHADMGTTANIYVHTGDEQLSMRQKF